MRVLSCAEHWSGAVAVSADACKQAHREAVDMAIIAMTFRRRVSLLVVGEDFLGDPIADMPLGQSA